MARQGSAGQNTSTVALTTTVLGTSAYMAPEAFRGDVSVKMDVFSFGVVGIITVKSIVRQSLPYKEKIIFCLI